MSTFKQYAWFLPNARYIANSTIVLYVLLRCLTWIHFFNALSGGLGLGMGIGMGIKIANQLSAAYSYEFSGKGIASYSGGSHEILIGYHFSGNKKDDDRLKALEERLDKQFAEQQRMIDSLANLINTNTTELDSLKAAQDAMKAGQDALKTDSEEAKRRIQELENRIKGLNNDLNSVEKEATSPAIPSSLEDKYSLSEAERSALRKHIQFGLNGASALESSAKDMNVIAGILKKHSSLTLRLVGHTCNTGSDANNNRLSKKRAEMVADYFRGQGISSKQLNTIGKGASQPTVKNDTLENRKKNRRVAFQIIEE